MYAASRTAPSRPQGRMPSYAGLLVADRAVDLLRVNSALCTVPGIARRQG
ncbi:MULTISPECIES: hypothetical protein [Streptomyces]|uniref:Uncharacterized protein n=1 Tax=Streptomyces eurythermus TaxID=42237 RepID=A0ABW6YQA4_9ACTN|nr:MULTISPECIES: hypothetical protein [Streptomyces]QIS74441.1 hypothetical protein HB370_34365 [Streptomyces sp. DSM 40868]WDM15182.1 hypothetical protein J3S85_28905 [Streptomyces lavenduligriseus]